MNDTIIKIRYYSQVNFKKLIFYALITLAIWLKIEVTIAKSAIHTSPQTVIQTSSQTTAFHSIRTAGANTAVAYLPHRVFSAQSADKSKALTQAVSANTKKLVVFSHAKLVSPLSSLQWPEEKAVSAIKIPIGIYIHLKKGWHSYWKQPGESGKALTVKWQLPSEWKVDELKWPLPERFTTAVIPSFKLKPDKPTASKALISFGYKQSFLLQTVLYLHKDNNSHKWKQYFIKRKNKSIDISAQVSWLICKNVCIPMSQNLQFSWPLTRTATTNTYWKKIFTKNQINKVIFLKKTFFAKLQNDHWRVEMDWTAPGKLVNVFPLSLKMFSAQAPEILSTNPEKHIFKIKKTKKSKETRTKAILVFKHDKEDDSIENAINCSVGVSADNSANNSANNSADNSTDNSANNSADDSTDNSANDSADDLTDNSTGNSANNSADNSANNSEDNSVDNSEDNSANDSANSFAGSFTKNKRIIKNPAKQISAYEMVFQKQTRSIFWFLLLAFLGGLILNLMPCVLPVVFLKFSNTLEQAHKKPFNMILFNIFYSVGVISSFIVLAFLLIGLKKTGESIGWGFQMQSPYFLISIILLFIFISFNFMGWFSVRLPAFASVYRGSEYFKHFFTGVLSTSSASPCTAPFMGASIGYALSAGFWEIIFIFFFLGLGLSFPYLLLSVFPQWIHYVPRPGAWSEKLKRGMSFPMLAAVAWLIYVFSRLHPESLLPLLLSLLFLSFGFWLLNNVQAKGIKHLAKIFIIASAVFVFFLPLKSDRGQIPWQVFSTQTLNLMRSQGKPVFVNFTADWCLICKWNEQAVFKNKKIIHFFKEHNIQAFKGDWTDKNPEITHVLNSYSRSGIPFYLYFPADQNSSDKGLVLPEWLTTGLLLKYLKPE